MTRLQFEDAYGCVAAQPSAVDRCRHRGPGGVALTSTTATALMAAENTWLVCEALGLEAQRLGGDGRVSEQRQIAVVIQPNGWSVHILAATPMWLGMCSLS